MFWKTLAQEDQGHCHGGDHLDGQEKFLIILSMSGSFGGELGWFIIASTFSCNLVYSVPSVSFSSMLTSFGSIAAYTKGNQELFVYIQGQAWNS